MKPFDMMGREELLRVIEMFAKNWLAHDGCWFLAAEERFGIQTAIELDACSWARFAAVEARRIMLTFDIPPGGGLPALEKALSLRLYAVVNGVLSVGLRKEGEPTYFCEESPRIRRTEVRPSRSRRAISALATPARCSLRISAA